jgi:cytochrome c peroxidase
MRSGAKPRVGKIAPFKRKETAGMRRVGKVAVLVALVIVGAAITKATMVNGMMAIGDGPIKTFPLRGIKDSPPYLHDGRLLTLDDTVEFFNLVLGTQLTAQEKQDLVAFLRAL